MTQEVDSLKRLLATVNGKSSVEFEIARTYAAGGQYRDTIHWLQIAIDSNSGFDPSRDPLFDKLHGTKEFQALVDKARSNTPSVSSSRPVATIPEADLFPENLAYDSLTRTFFIGSTFKNEVVRCHEREQCKPFVGPGQDGLGHVLGLKIHQPSRTLWVTSNTSNDASLRQYSLATGKLLHNYSAPGAHLFNDLAIALSGEVFVTDTKGGSVYRLPGENHALERLTSNHKFTAANGIALSSEEKKLYVSNFGDGITVVDLASGTAKPMVQPPGVSLAYIDGLYCRAESLVAIQNGPMAPRIVRFSLSPDGSRIIAMKILEQRNPLFDGLTTGTLVSDQLYYIANTQIDKVVNGKI